MAVVGSLSVNIVAKTDQLIKGLQKSQVAIGKFVSKISMASIAATGLGTYAIARMTNDVIQSGDAINDLSAKLNIGTEQLGALQYAAEQLGGSAESMNKGLQFLNKNIGLMQQGSQGAVDAFARLGLDANKLSRLTLDKKFMAVAAAINSLSTDTEQAAAAQQIFGKGGAELLPIIRAGTKAIVEMGDAVAKTGSLFTSEQAAKMNEASDSLKELTASWRGLKIELVQGFVPALSSTFGWLSGVVQMFRQLQIAIKYAVLQMTDLHPLIDNSVELEQAAKEWASLSSPNVGNPLSAPAAPALPPQSRQSGGVFNATSMQNASEQTRLLQRIATATEGRGDDIDIGTVGVR